MQKNAAIQESRLEDFYRFSALSSHSRRLITRSGDFSTNTVQLVKAHKKSARGSYLNTVLNVI